MNYYAKGIITASILVLSTQAVRSQQDCELKKEKDDLKVYTCDSENEKLKTIKTELILENTSFAELVDFVEDVEYYVNWQYNTIEAKVLHRNAASTIYRTVVQAPWPVSNREMITEVSSHYDSATQLLIIKAKSSAYDYPKNSDMVRVPFSEGIWRVTPRNGSSLKIVYTLQIDPGGSVPLWLMNIALAEGPFKSFMEVKNKIKHRSKGSMNPRKSGSGN